MRLTTVQYLLLKRIYYSGEVKSLRRLCMDLNIDYSNAHKQINRLKSKELITVTRNNRELVIRPKLKTAKPYFKKRRTPALHVQAKMIRRNHKL